MKKTFVVLSMLVAVGGSFYGCNDDEDPIIPNEEEVITSLIYTLTPVGGGLDVEFRFVDLDGDGGDDPFVTVDTLEANQTYTGSVKLLNESETPSEDITLEVLEEDEEHQLFFVSSVSDVSITYSDQDANGNPVGVNTEVMSGDSANGTLTVILRHEPNKEAAGVKDGDPTNAGGETDIEVVFPLYVR